MARTERCFLVAVFVGLWVGRASAEPFWTKTGDCRSCHSTVLPGAMSADNFYTRANPTEAAGQPDRGRLKVFWAKPGEVKSLFASVSGLNADDHYGAMIKQFNLKGVQTNATLSYSADCGWSQWWGATGFSSDPPRSNLPEFHYVWPTGPQGFNYNITVGAACPSDYYCLTVAVAGAPAESTGFFYSEELFYLRVSAVPPPVVKIADFDSDGDVDGVDFGSFAACFNGTGNPLPSAACADIDMDKDGDVDGADFGVFAACFNGTGNPPAGGCPK